MESVSRPNPVDSASPHAVGRADAHHQMAYSEQQAPVLPAGWAPLTSEQAHAVLQACDAAPESVVLRLASIWDRSAEYRAYHLADEHWGGLWVACRYYTQAPHAPRDTAADLLGLAPDSAHAVQIALDSFNADLEVQGEDWRLDVARRSDATRNARRPHERGGHSF